jgi:hypothetical protein
MHYETPMAALCLVRGGPALAFRQRTTPAVGWRFVVIDAFPTRAA